MTSSRRTNLNRIMQIEQEIKKIRTDTRYRQILNNINIMNHLTRGSRNIDVASPDNMDRTITVRRRSQEAKDVVKSYKLNLQKFSSRLQTLTNEKATLEKQLFR